MYEDKSGSVFTGFTGPPVSLQLAHVAAMLAELVFLCSISERDTNSAGNTCSQTGSGANPVSAARSTFCTTLTPSATFGQTATLSKVDVPPAHRRSGFNSKAGAASREDDGLSHSTPVLVQTCTLVKHHQS